MKKWFIFALMGLVTACGADTEEATTAPADPSAVNVEKAREVFEATFEDMTVTDARPSAIPGIVELDVGGAETVYMSEDGNHLLIGKMLQIKDGEVINPAEQRLEKVRVDGIAALDEASMITYQAEDEKHEVYVFTDITCGYCRKLHRHIDEFNAEGITVHYLAFPRGGPGANAANAMRHIWCAEDPRMALTDAKLKDEISPSELGDCAKIVDEQYELGRTFGVRGTPAIYTVEGKQLGGYVAPDDMLDRLE